MVKRDVGENEEAIKEKTLSYFGVTTVVVIVWFILSPLYKPFLRDVLLLDNYESILNIVWISVGFYVLFAYNNVIDSIFYGMGKTEYMLFQSIVINTLFYGTLFILYVTGLYVPTLELIALMFAAGIAFDSLLTYGMFYWMLKKKNIGILKEYQI